MTDIAKSSDNDPLKSATAPAVSMPSRLVLIRHGESEANLVNRAIKNGRITEYPEGFDKIPDREIRLSELGCEQAKATGPWLRQQYPDGFDLLYVSDHTRAKETGIRPPTPR
jgi:broad specificity phosphatase PhoE